MPPPENYLQPYHKLIVYQKAKVLVLLIYRITKSFPKEELFVLLPQMRRAAVSVAANIVEGYVKKSRKDFSRFLGISIGSLAELQIYLELCLNLKYLSEKEFHQVLSLSIEVQRLLYSFQKSLKSRVGE